MIFPSPSSIQLPQLRVKRRRRVQWTVKNGGRRQKPIRLNSWVGIRGQRQDGMGKVACRHQP